MSNYQRVYIYIYIWCIKHAGHVQPQSSQFKSCIPKWMISKHITTISQWNTFLGPTTKKYIKSCTYTKQMSHVKYPYPPSRSTYRCVSHCCVFLFFSESPIIQICTTPENKQPKGVRYGGFLKWRYPKFVQKLTILVLKPVITHGDLGMPHLKREKKHIPSSKPT